MDYNRLIQSKDVFTKIKQYKIHSRNRSEHLNLRSKNTFNRTSTKISQTVEGTSREMCHLPPKPLFWDDAQVTSSLFFGSKQIIFAVFYTTYYSTLYIECGHSKNGMSCTIGDTKERCKTKTIMTWLLLLFLLLWLLLLLYTHHIHGMERQPCSPPHTHTWTFSRCPGDCPRTWASTLFKYHTQGRQVTNSLWPTLHWPITTVPPPPPPPPLALPGRLTLATLKAWGVWRRWRWS